MFRHSEVVDARVARLEATEQDLRTTILNLNNMLQQTLVSFLFEKMKPFL